MIFLVSSIFYFLVSSSFVNDILFLDPAIFFSRCGIFCLYILMVNYRMKLKEDISGFRAPCDVKPIWCTSYRFACLFFKLFKQFHFRFE